MADSDRDRIDHFRQRWALDYFRSSGRSSPIQSQTQTRQSSSRQASSRQTPVSRNMELAEVDAPSPALNPEGRSKRFQQRSWREHLRRSPEHRVPDVGAPRPVYDEEPTTSSSELVDTYANEEAGERQTHSKNPQQSTQQSNERPAWLTELYTLGYLTFFALFGTLARLGVEVISQYPDAPVTSRVLWANLGGSFVMGFLTQDRRLFGIPHNLEADLKKGDGESVDEAKVHSTHLKHKKSLSLYVGLTTGFCGSFTSFSSFIRDAFLALTNDLSPPSPTRPYRSSGPSHSRNGGFSFLAMMAILILHPAVSLAALKTGAHFAILSGRIIRHRVFTPTVLNMMDPVMLFLGFGCWVGSLFLTIFPPSSGPTPVDWRARATIPLVFAPLGCILRFYLAKWLNRPSTPNFPMGTFAANVFGTLVLGMAWDLAHARSIGANPSGGNACAVLLGVEEGFCGCLTTVSTWVLEISGLRRGRGWIYGLTSVAISLAGMIIIMGSVGWTIGFAEPVCG